MVDMAHFAGLVAGKVFTGDFDPVPHAHIVTTTTHKSLRGPRGGMVLCQPELAEAVDRGCPMVLGGPLPHVMAAKAVALAEARQPSFRDVRPAHRRQRQALAEGLIRRGARLVTGGTDNHLVLIDVGGFGLTGRQAERPCWTPASSPTATRSRGTRTAPGTPPGPDRHPGADHPRAGHRGDGRGRRADPRGAEPARPGPRPAARRRRRTTCWTTGWPTGWPSGGRAARRLPALPFGRSRLIMRYSAAAADCHGGPARTRTRRSSG